MKLSRTPLNSLFSDYPFFLDSVSDVGFTCVEQLASCYSNDHIANWLQQAGCCNENDLQRITKKLRTVRHRLAQFHTQQAFQAASPISAAALLTVEPTEIDYQFSLPVAALNIPEKVDLIQQYQMLPIKDQAHRGTCTAQAAATLAELTLGINFPLSAAAIYLEAKKIDGNTKEGTSLQRVLKALKQSGSCAEELAPYYLLLASQDLNAVKLTPIAKEHAKKHKIQDFLVMEPGSQPISVCKAILAGALSGKPRPIMVGMKEDLHLLTHPFAYVTGEISGHSPLDTDFKWYHHARVLLGAHDHPDYPGGGYVILSQSWGEQYASASIFTPGTNVLSYKHFTEQCLAVGLILFDNERTLFSSDKEQQFTVPQVSCATSKAFNFIPFHNNHIGIWGKTGLKKSTLVASELQKLLKKEPKLNIHYICPHNHVHTLLQTDYSIINVSKTGMPFSFLHNTIDAPKDLTAHALMEDFKCASGALGARQSGAIRRLLEKALDAKSLNNLELKASCEQQLTEDIQDHLAPLLLLLRTNNTVELDNPGLHLHYLRDFRRSKSSQVLYAVSLMNYLLNHQIKDSSQPTILVLDEAKMFFTPLGLSFLDSLLSEARKFNLHLILISQERPEHKFIDNLAHEINLSGAPDKPLADSPLQLCLTTSAHVAATPDIPQSVPTTNALSKRMPSSTANTQSRHTEPASIFGSRLKQLWLWFIRH